MKASQLRDLTRRYAGGQLGREEYEAERARLIDGIVSGRVELRYRELEPAAVQADQAGRHRLLTGGTITLAALLLVALLVYFIDSDAGRGETPAAVAPPVPAENPGTKRLDAFMRAGDWTERSLAQLESDWSNLSAFHRENARRSAPFQRLKYETGRRITEQEALLAAGEMEALLQAERLREFAKQLGIPVDP